MDYFRIQDSFRLKKYPTKLTNKPMNRRNLTLHSFILLHNLGFLIEVFRRFARLVELFLDVGETFDDKILDPSLKHYQLPLFQPNGFLLSLALVNLLRVGVIGPKKLILLFL